MSLPCDGIRVVDFTWGMPGNMASMILADYGAEVVKVERPGGDPYREHPAWPFWNRGKGSTVLDLKSEAGLERARKLIQGADVLVESFRPSVMERLGLGYDTARALNPAVVYCSITGFGAKGPFAHLKGYEGVVVALTGRMLEFAGLVEPPRPAFAAVASASHGALHAAVQGILAALHVRRQTHRGSHVETSLLQGNTAYDLIRWYAHQAAGGNDLARDRLRSWGAYTAAIPGPFYLTAVTKDGVWLQFANFVGHTYVAQMNALGLTDLYSDPRYANLPSLADPADADDVWEAVLNRVREKTWAEWKAILDEERDVAVEPFVRTAEAFDHPQVRHNGHVIKFGDCEQLGPIVVMSDTPATPARPAPAVDDPNGVRFEGWTARAVEAASEAPAAPLAGKVVLDFATFYATPFGGALLADLGARVIKIEPPGGEVSRFSAGRMLFFKTTGGKESIAIDLKAAEGQEIVHRLIARADILMHNFRPGAPERLGIGYETARQLNPKILYHYGASYGISGPYWFKPSMHPIPGAAVGGAIQQMPPQLLSSDDPSLPMAELKRKAWRLQGANEANPDVSSALGLATGIMLGLQAAETLGTGQYQYTTMLLSNLYANGEAGTRGPGVPPRKEPDAELLGLGPLYRLYQARDGGWIFLAVCNDREWGQLCDAAERPDWATDPRFATGDARHKNHDALSAGLTELFQCHDADEWEALLTSRDVAAARADRASVAEFAVEEPSNRELGFTVAVDHPLYGSYFRHGPIVTIDTSPPRLGPACEPGEDTLAILAELGYTEREVLALKEKGVVGWPDDPQ